VLLSAGVDYEEYVKQVALAMECGASGILGGRAFWKEYFKAKTQNERETYTQEIAAKRVKELAAMVHQKATPWFKWYGLTKEQIASVYVSEGWHFRYADPFTLGLEAQKRTASAEQWGY
jgi:tagatose 1,6-diphosphate aldolase